MKFSRRFRIPEMVLWCTALCFVSISWAADESSRILFSHLSEAEGFEADRVNAVTEDQRGMLWLATNQGLNRFDGAGTLEFRHDPLDSESLSSNRISSLVFGPQGDLWVGTANAGLNRFKPLAMKAERLPLRAEAGDHGFRSDEITCLAVTANQFLWVGTREGLDILHLQSGKIHAAAGLAAGTHVTRIFVDSAESVWTASESGELFNWDEELSEFQLVWTAGVPISDIVADSNNGLWIGTLGQGLMRLNVETGRTTPASLASRDITSLRIDTNGDLWVGTTEGLGNLGRGAYEFDFYRNDPLDSTSLSGLKVNCLFESKAKVIWVGTETGGASRFGLNRHWFPHYRSNPEEDRSNRLPHDSIWSMAPTKDGQVWIGTEFGLTRWNPDDETYMTPEFGAEIGSPYVSAILESDDGTIWAGTKGNGLIAMPGSDPARAVLLRHQPDNPDAIGHDFVSALFEDSQTELWIGTHGNGLWRLGESGSDFIEVPAETIGGDQGDNGKTAARFITSVAEDRKGQIFVAASDGLYVVDPAAGKVLPYQADGSDAQPFSKDSVSSIFVAADGAIFAGTMNHGLKKIAASGESIKIYNRSNSDLPSDTILGLLEDLHGKIWVTTREGVASFDPGKERFRLFDDLDGLQKGTLHLNTCARTEDGNLYFGGGQGFHRIDPDSLPLPRQPPTPYLTGFERFGEPVIPQPGGILEKSIAATAEIRIPYDRHNSFGFRFANLGSEFPFRGEFRYQLVGFDKGWQLAKKDRKASYPAMSAGHYEFQVQSSKDGEEWNANIARVRLTIAPPWWQTRLAMAGFVVTFLGAVALVFWLLRRAQIKRMERREQKLKSQRDRAEARLAIQLQNAVLLERTSHSISENVLREAVFEEPLKNLAQHYRVNRCLLCSLQTSDDDSLQLVGIGEYQVGDTGVTHDLAIPVGDPFTVEILDSETPVQRDNMLAMRTSFQGKQNGVLLVDGSDDQARSWSKEESNLIQGVAVQFGIAIAQRELSQKEESYRQQLEQARRTAEEANQAKSTFLARMTHDLRTPLSAILGFARILKEDDNLEGRQRDTVNIISDSGEHLLSVINDILDVSKIEAGKTEINLEQFELLPMLQNIQDLLKEKVESKGLTFNFSAISALPLRVETDRGKLRQILVNLLGNAIKFTDRGSIGLKVGARVHTASENADALTDCQVRLFFQVSDTGQGIAEEDFHRLFQDFSQTDSGRGAADSTGLGLAIAKSFANLLGGDIQVSSKVGVGTAFEFSILCKEIVEAKADHRDQPAARISSTDEQRVVTGLAASSRGTRILIADDEKLNRLLLNKILGRVGFELVEASDGKEACEKWRETKPQLILMDENMPGMQGSEASRIIRRECEPGQEPVMISLTANAFAEAQEEALAAGFQDFIAKPFQQEELLAMIAKHLDIAYTYRSDAATSETARMAGGNHQDVALSR